MLIRVIIVTLALTLLAGCGPISSSPPTTPTAPATAPAAPTAAVQPTVAQTNLHWASPPVMRISTRKIYTATISTTMGNVVIRLLPKSAPLAVNNFVFLVQHRFYSDVPFHRIIKGFMVQTGDPTGTGSGGPGYTFSIEPTKGTFTPGTVAMANTGRPNSNGSQFFICQGAQCSSLSNAPAPGYTIFGRVVNGMSVVNRIASVPVTGGQSGEKSQPLHPVLMKDVRITVTG